MWWYSCKSLQIRDVNNISLSGYTIANQFKLELWEQGSGHGSIDFPESCPLLQPNIIDSTGEYY